MPRARRKDVVYESADVTPAIKRWLNSRAAWKQLVVCFCQRRLNTSYSRRLWYRGTGDEMRMRERWLMVEGRPQSVIEVYSTGTGEVFGKSYADGTIWIKNDFNPPWYVNHKFWSYVWANYQNPTEEGEGKRHVSNGRRFFEPRTTPVDPVTSFGALTASEWSV